MAFLGFGYLLLLLKYLWWSEEYLNLSHKLLEGLSPMVIHLWSLVTSVLAAPWNQRGRNSWNHDNITSTRCVSCTWQLLSCITWSTANEVSNSSITPTTAYLGQINLGIYFLGKHTRKVWSRLDIWTKSAHLVSKLYFAICSPALLNGSMHCLQAEQYDFLAEFWKWSLEPIWATKVTELKFLKAEADLN